MILTDRRCSEGNAKEGCHRLESICPLTNFNSHKKDINADKYCFVLVVSDEELMMIIMVTMFWATMVIHVAMRWC